MISPQSITTKQPSNSLSPLHQSSSHHLSPPLHTRNSSQNLPLHPPPRDHRPPAPKASKYPYPLQSKPRTPTPSRKQAKPQNDLEGVSYWPSRDPIGERGGMNFYALDGNDILNGVDVLGNKIVNVDEWTISQYETGDEDSVTVFLTLEGICLSDDFIDTSVKVILSFFSKTYVAVDLDGTENHTADSLSGANKTFIEVGGESYLLKSDGFKRKDGIIEGNLLGKIHVGDVDCCGSKLSGDFAVKGQVERGGKLKYFYQGKYSVEMQECGIVVNKNVSLENHAKINTTATYIITDTKIDNNIVDNGILNGPLDISKK
jgi:hypothetical protein